jgi:hypothetical protein
MLAPLLHLSRPKLRESNAQAQSSDVREPRNADTNAEVLRAWMARIREARLRVQNQPARCERGVCGELSIGAKINSGFASEGESNSTGAKQGV